MRNPLPNPAPIPLEPAQHTAGTQKTSIISGAFHSSFPYPSFRQCAILENNAFLYHPPVVADNSDALGDYHD
jgi:hypothetical protein